MDILLLILLVTLIILVIFTIISINSSKRETRQDLWENLKNLSDILGENQQLAKESQIERLVEIRKQIERLSIENEQKLENIRNTVERRLSSLQEDNNRQLEYMRNTVDEKLQKTLEERIAKSFQIVNEQLEKVSRGFGEMQALTSNVSDLQKVLSNVKTRGILGEVQLRAILEQILSPEQYEENIQTKTTGNERVEFAIKLPGNGQSNVYLPIDSKFPGDAYSNLVDAQNSGDNNIIKLYEKQLETAIKKSAKDIFTKYIEPPATTDFAIMFLPFEGLYAEVVRLGLIEKLQREYNINIAGPTTMAALLNSLQMGFKTLAIQKRSSEVWKTLEAVKTEFGNFTNILAKTQKKLDLANRELENLVGTRTNQINRKLKDVATIDEMESNRILELEDFQESLQQQDKE